MLFNSTNHKPRRKCYYPFSVNYPGKRGNSYDIGESRTRRKKDERNNIIFYALTVVLFVVAFIFFSVSIILSHKPINNTVSTQACEFKGAYKALQMPDEALEGGIAYDLFKTELNSSDANAVVITFKTNEGKLNFQSESDTAKKIGAADNAYPKFNDILSDLKESGYKIIARVYCFEDRVAAAMISGAGVKEKNSSAVWLDDSAQRDGNPWLNPYSQSASNYLIGIINECKKSGADVILLCSASFPAGSRLENAVFTEDSDAKTRNEMLLSFIKRVKSNCEELPVVVYIPADKALNGSKMLYDGSIIDSAADYNAVDFRKCALADGFEYNGNVFTKDSFSENSLIQLAIPLLTDEKSENFPDKKIIPIIDEKIYISALENLGIEDYILINE